MNQQTSSNTPSFFKKYKKVIIPIVVVIVVAIVVAIVISITSKKKCPVGESCEPTQDNASEGICDNESKCLPTVCADGYKLNAASLSCSKIVPGDPCTSPVSPIPNALTYKYGSDGKCDEVNECVKGYDLSDDNRECKEIPKPPPTIGEIKECVYSSAKSCVFDKCKECITKPTVDCVKGCLGECKNTIQGVCLPDCNITNLITPIEKCIPALVPGLADCAITKDDKKACVKKLFEQDSSFVNCAMGKINDACPMP